MTGDAGGSGIDEATAAWLMGGDPAIRWQVMQDLLGASGADVAAERARIAITGWGAELMRLQDPGGTWGGGLYSPKWVSTTYTLLQLYRCGLPPDTAAARRGVELLWEGARYFDGGLTPAKSIDAPEACATAMYVMLARHFAFADPRVDAAAEWLIAAQLPDGGWNCRTARYGDTHGSFHTSILALESLAEESRLKEEDEAVRTAMRRGREFFLEHRLFKSHCTGSIVDTAFTRFPFPPRWHYDVLRGLDHFRSVSSPWDRRFTDALVVVNGRRRRDGTWPAHRGYAGKVWFEMEAPGRPGRWNTLRALRVLRWAAGGD